MSCHSTSPSLADLPRRSCALTIWHHAASAEARVEIVGSWNHWQRPGVLLPAARSDGWRVTSFELPPGAAEYSIIEDGSWLTDENVGTTAFYEGHEVTWTDIPNCNVPGLQIVSAAGSSDGSAMVTASFFASAAGPGVAPETISVTDETGNPVNGVTLTRAAHGAIDAAFLGLPAGKHVYQFEAKDGSGIPAEPARATVWIEPRPWDWRDASIYQVMVDRYRDQNGSVAQPATADGWAGGNVDGVRAAIESGEIPNMGFNAIWLSPLYQNPTESFQSSDGHSYSGYHGYWPQNSRALDPHFATDDSLKALISAAHAHDMRIIFDVVPHHVAEGNAYVTSHKDGSWFTDWGGNCVCGTSTCGWATHIQDCWFTNYLPTLDWTRDDVADQITGDVSWWLDRYNGDGLRIDAVPMMPRAATRRIANAVRTKFDHDGQKTYLLGENFTGDGGYESLRYELGPFGLDGEFHFPLMWAIRGAVAWASSPMSTVADAMVNGETDWKNSGSVMSLMIGNHDVTRFSSESAGDASGDGWTPAPQSTDPLVYQKQRLALGLIFTMPGAPVVYYGDEIGLAGRADPDSRRVMPPQASWTNDMLATRDFTSRMLSIRHCSDALRRGEYRTLVADDEHLVFARESASGQVAVVVIFRNGESGIDSALPGIAAGTWQDALSGARVTVDPARTVIAAAAPWSMMVLFPSGDACGG